MSRPRRGLRFSIVTCTWNSEPFIARTIESVLEQDWWPDIEWIFVDGGSTDGTLERIRAIPHDVVLATGVRGGISRAMNEGIRLAGGDVIAHLHSDDYYAHPGVLRRVAEVLERTGARWLFGRNLRDIDGQVSEEAWRPPAYRYSRLLRRNFIPHESTFVRRDLFQEAGGFSDRWKYGMDYDMWLRLGRIAEPVQIDDCLAVFREHPGSLSSANPLPAFREDFRIRMSHLGRAPWAHFEHALRYLVRQRRLRS